MGKSAQKYAIEASISTLGFPSLAAENLAVPSVSPETLTEISGPAEDENPILDDIKALFGLN